MSGPEDTGGVQIRELRAADWPADYEAVVRLWEAAGLRTRPLGRDSASRVALELERATAVFLLAEKAGRLVGVVVATHDGRKGWINRLAVAPDCRREGIAACLVGAAEERLTSAGIDIVAALIETPNTASLALFRSLGYKHDPHIEYFSKRRSPDT